MFAGDMQNFEGQNPVSLARYFTIDRNNEFMVDTIPLNHQQE